MHYQYEESIKEPIKEPIPVSSEAVATLPHEFLETLRETARSLSDMDFIDALDPVRNPDPDLAEGLAVLAREFQFGKLQNLLEKHGEKYS